MLRIYRFASAGMFLSVIMALALWGVDLQNVAAQPSAASQTDAAHRDAQLYAEHAGVDVNEANNRFRIQELAGELDAKLSVVEPQTFAGLWLEHSPQFRVVVQFTTDPEKTIKPYVADQELADVLVVQTAKVSLAELQAEQAKALTMTRSWGIQAESGINIRENRVELNTTDRAQIENTIREHALLMNWPEHVEIITVPMMGTADADIYGGLSLSTCTSGFAVRNSSGTRGILTAAHCSNSQSYNGTSLTFRSEQLRGSYDTQWHTASGYTLVNKIRWWSDGSTRNITAAVGRSTQVIGGYVCKYGKTTFYTCGYISDKNFAPSYIPSVSPTFIRVDNSASYPDLSSGGDSGGPWFLTSSAYGTHSGAPGADPNDAIYMAINYISGINVSLMTSP